MKYYCGQNNSIVRKGLQFFILVCVIFSLKSFAQTGGAIDLTFGGVGYVSYRLGSSSTAAKATITQPDGKIIAVGDAFGSISGNAAVIVRFNSTGSLDTSFGTGGIVYVASVGSEYFRAVALLPEGKIVAVGLCSCLSDQFLIVRFNADGSLDSTFDSDGIVTTNMVAGSFDQARALAIQPDGKIVVLGSSQYGVNTDFAIARYNSNGSLDTSFSDDGKVVLNLSNSTANGADDGPGSVALQHDGKIVVVGYANTAGNPIVFRLNSTGTLDTTFGNNGIVIRPPRTGGGLVAIQWDGKIVTAGNTSFPYDFTVIRYNPDGSLDTTFDNDGVVTTNMSATVSDDFVRSMVLRSDGKIFVGGYTGNTNANYAIAVYNIDGSLDNAWGDGGKVTTTFDPYSQGQLYGIASSVDGKVVASGLIHLNFGVVRYQGSPIAATAKIKGQIVNSAGKPISKARVILTNPQTGETKINLTNPFGYYNFSNLPTETNYTVSVSSKQSTFYQNTKSLQLFMDVLGLNFSGN
jgi:uncharacterized delta-60 repeat protein